jgi:hypothetical protein
VIVAGQLAGAGLAMGAALGLTTVVTDAVDGATGTWAPDQSAAVAAATVVTDTATPPPGPASAQSVDPITPAAPEAT